MPKPWHFEVFCDKWYTVVMQVSDCLMSINNIHKIINHILLAAKRLIHASADIFLYVGFLFYFYSHSFAFFVRTYKGFLACINMHITSVGFVLLLLTGLVWNTAASWSHIKGKACEASYIINWPMTWQMVKEDNSWACSSDLNLNRTHIRQKHLQVSR